MNDARSVFRMRCREALASLLLAVLLFAPSSLPAQALEKAPGADAPLQFRITEGRIENAFYQDGGIAAHLLLSSGERPRVLVAFPAGNSGAGVWFEDAPSPVQWTLGVVKGRVVTLQGHRWNGIEAQASLVAERLVLKDAVLGSVRVLRDYQLGLPYPEGTGAEPAVSERQVRWRRERLDGAPGYEISLTAENGSFKREQGKLVLSPDQKDQPLRLRIRAFTG